jgi:hypothetical protein
MSASPPGRLFLCLGIFPRNYWAHKYLFREIWRQRYLVPYLLFWFWAVSTCIYTEDLGTRGGNTF